MSLSSDAIIKQEIYDNTMIKSNKLELRIFPESSVEDQKLVQDGGLTFGYDNIQYGSCDALWLLNDQKYIDPYNSKEIDIKPVVAIEGTDALSRGSSGNAQLQRFHHALGALKSGVIGVYYLNPGSHEVRPDLYILPYNASKMENGYYI